MTSSPSFAAYAVSAVCWTAGTFLALAGVVRTIDRHRDNIAAWLWRISLPAAARRTTGRRAGR